MLLFIALVLFISNVAPAVNVAATDAAIAVAAILAVATGAIFITWDIIQFWSCQLKLCFAVNQRQIKRSITITQIF